jgi:hypothetical protein
MRKVFLLFALLTFNAYPKEPELFDGFWKNIGDSFKDNNAYLHLSAAAVTPALIYSDADANIHDALDSTSDLPLPGVAIGWIAPLAFIAPLYVYGKSESDDDSLGAAYALTQTTIITLSYISVLKGLTGRPAPRNSDEKSIREQSRDFNFGILERGINWGWPSGHVGTTTALVTTLTYYYPEKAWLKWTGNSFIAYMIYTVSTHNEGQMHWFSDAVAGTLVGYAIGSTVGGNYRNQMKGESVDNNNNVSIMPIFGREMSGIKVTWMID